MKLKLGVTLLMASLISGVVLACSSFQVNATTLEKNIEDDKTQIYHFNDGIYLKLAEAKDLDAAIITITFANKLDADVDFFPMGKNTYQKHKISGNTLTLHIDDKYDITQREIAFIALDSPNSITSIDLKRKHDDYISYESNVYSQIYVGKYFYSTNTPGNMLPDIPGADYSTPPTPGYSVPDPNQPGNMLPNIPGLDYSTPPTPGYSVPDPNQPGNMLPNVPGLDYSTPPTPGYSVPDPNQPGNMLPGHTNNPPVAGNNPNQPGNMLPGYTNNPPVAGNDTNQPGNMLPSNQYIVQPIFSEDGFIKW
ncbi:MAG: hypothetical protein ATN31_10130 [Candidatus Epulonipiscioides saccharophilum]|nr:MAG: hypothetical protein ATN31_10130 [Epulopiscium sp. AS2M-Bin001]